MTRLREYQKMFQPNVNLPTTNIEDIVRVHEKFQPRMLSGKWELLMTL